MPRFKVLERKKIRYYEVVINPNLEVQKYDYVPIKLKKKETLLTKNQFS